MYSVAANTDDTTENYETKTERQPCERLWRTFFNLVNSARATGMGTGTWTWTRSPPRCRRVTHHRLIWHFSFCPPGERLLPRGSQAGNKEYNIVNKTYTRKEPTGDNIYQQSLSLSHPDSFLMLFTQIDRIIHFSFFANEIFPSEVS